MRCTSREAHSKALLVQKLFENTLLPMAVDAPKLKQFVHASDDVPLQPILTGRYISQNQPANSH